MPSGPAVGDCAQRVWLAVVAGGPLELVLRLRQLVAVPAVYAGFAVEASAMRRRRGQSYECRVHEDLGRDAAAGGGVHAARMAVPRRRICREACGALAGHIFVPFRGLQDLQQRRRSGC